MSDIIITLFLPELQKKLVPNNTFWMGRSKSDAASAIVENGTAATVQIPQEGLAPSGGKNPNSYPLTVERRVDSVISYALDLIYTNPTLVTLMEEWLVNYGKANSVLDLHAKKLMSDIADTIIYNWVNGLAAGSIVLTTGSARDAGYADLGQTGNRKAMTYTDLQKAATILNKQRVPNDNRFLLPSFGMWQDIKTDPAFYRFDAIGKVNQVGLDMGFVGEIAGFLVLPPRETVIANAAGTTQYQLHRDGSFSVDGIVSGSTFAAPASSSSDCSVVWQADQVRTAIGTPKIFPRIKDPLFQGDIFSANVFAGGSRSREDKKGVVLIVEGT